MAEPVRGVVGSRVRDEELSVEAFDCVLEAQTVITPDSHTLLGPADPVQDDPRYGAAAHHADPSLRDRDAWTLLLQFDDTFASYGDGDGLFVVIPRADLAAGRYDRAVAQSQSY